MGEPSGEIILDQKALLIPTSWSKPCQVFVNSMSDRFRAEVPPDFITEDWRVMAEWDAFSCRGVSSPMGASP
ncbi:DUF5131 family protein [Mesorhizobium amorphae]|uniref:DUF5131 family protein n=1 Tax=Mesorhizobium amorphae TaxID=71433 RepID=UPI0021B3C52F|nr:DUF5131 family protein [Mesorhizobium amorphae]